MAASLERPLRTRLLAAAGVAALFGAALAWRALYDPSVAYLAGGGPPWILAPKPVGLRARFTVPSFVHFRHRVAPGPVEGELVLRARRESQVVLDGKVVLPPGEAAGGWKGERRVVLSPGPGEHELLVIVRAEPGPAALSAEVKAWGLRTDESWQAAGEDMGWPRAVLAGGPPAAPAEFADQPTAGQGFFFTLPLLLVLGGLAYGAARLCGRLSLRAAAAGVLAAWAVLAALAWARIDPRTGFDAEAHLEHARIVAGGRLPDASEGWQLFEPPLHFLLAAGLRRAAAGLLEPESLDRLSRLPSTASGAALGFLCLLGALAARPGRQDLALAALLCGAFLPASLSSAHAPGGQSLSASLAAGALVCGMMALARGTTPRLAAAAGALLGLAALAKATAFVSVPPVAAALVWGSRGRDKRALAAGAAAFLLLAGAHYGPTWLEHGKPVLGGWDLGGRWAWTQDPGYRTAGDFLRFGECLVRPVYSGLHGFWDALYSTWFLDGWTSGMVAAASGPPWSRVWQAACAWWGLVPSALLAAGSVRALRHGDPAGLVCVAGLAAGTAALLWLFLSLPIYSTVKASYLLGLTPAFALLVADGLDGLTGRARAAGWALLSGWAACSYLAHLPR